MVGHKFAYLRLCSIPTPCPALSYKWQLKENYNKYLMLIIHFFSINLLWPCWLRHQTITFYPKGHGFKSHQEQNFFFTFSDHFQLIWLCFHDINAPRSVWKHFWISESIHYKTTHCAEMDKITSKEEVQKQIYVMPMYKLQLYDTYESSMFFSHKI